MFWLHKSMENKNKIIPEKKSIKITLFWWFEFWFFFYFMFFFFCVYFRLIVFIWLKLFFLLFLKQRIWILFFAFLYLFNWKLNTIEQYNVIYFENREQDYICQKILGFFGVSNRHAAWLLAFRPNTTENVL